MKLNIYFYLCELLFYFIILYNMELERFQNFIEFIQEWEYFQDYKEKADNALEILGLYYSIIWKENEK